MKAARISEYGASEVIKVTAADKPSIGDDQVLVEVHASSINPFDVKVREGYLKDYLQLPITLGGDIAGVVAEAGANVTHVAPGDKVYGQANAVAGNSGAFAEYAATKGSEIAKLPANLDFVAAAAASLTGLSALQALVDHAQVQAGQKVLIHGGAGGVGTMAIQIAKQLGAYVVVTATGEGVAYTRQLGADEVIDYRTQQFDERLQDYDAVLDAIGGDTYRHSFKVLKKGGIIVSMLERPDRALMEQYSVNAVMVQARASVESLNTLSKLLEDGAVTVNVSNTFTLDQIREAFAAYEHRHIRGKVGIVVRTGD